MLRGCNGFGCAVTTANRGCRPSVPAALGSRQRRVFPRMHGIWGRYRAELVGHRESQLSYRSQHPSRFQSGCYCGSAAARRAPWESQPPKQEQQRQRHSPPLVPRQGLPELTRQDPAGTAEVLLPSGTQGCGQVGAKAPCGRGQEGTGRGMDLVRDRKRRRRASIKTLVSL